MANWKYISQLASYALSALCPPSPVIRAGLHKAWRGLHERVDWKYWFNEVPKLDFVPWLTLIPFNATAHANQNCFQQYLPLLSTDGCIWCQVKNLDPKVYCTYLCCMSVIWSNAATTYQRREKKSSLPLISWYVSVLTELWGCTVLTSQWFQSGTTAEFIANRDVTLRSSIMGCRDVTSQKCRRIILLPIMMFCCAVLLLTSWSSENVSHLSYSLLCTGAKPNEDGLNKSVGWRNSLVNIHKNVTGGRRSVSTDYRARLMFGHLT